MGAEIKRLAVFSVRQVKGQTVWNRVGGATTNRDGSINVYLDALPIDGKLHLREATQGDALKVPDDVVVPRQVLEDATNNLQTAIDTCAEELEGDFKASHSALVALMGAK